VVELLSRGKEFAANMEELSGNREEFIANVVE
jgi:hypothetical protein